MLRSTIQAKWSAPRNVVAFTTTRYRGVSKPPFGSFNLGDHVGDDIAAVQSNRLSLATDCGLPAEPCWLTQTHSTKVQTINANLPGTVADGAVTDIAGIVCAVLTADCLPLFLSNNNGTRVAVVHAGWQGLADGIIEQGVMAMGGSVEQLHAWAGPTIGVNHFEIGNEVRAQLGGSDLAYRNSPNAGKCFANLYQLARERLQAVGVNNYTHSENCTFADADQFFSHRRDQTTGRMASIIYFTEK